jgi:formylglycine-generating enzyme required for sulfatase activity
MSEAPFDSTASAQPEPADVPDLCRRFEAACRAGQQPRIEDYLAQTPPPQREQLLRVVLALELSFSSREGSPPSRESYHSRFPEYRAVIDEVYREVSPAAGVAPASATASDQGRQTADLDTQADPAGARAAGPRRPEVPGFKVLGLLGRGGMGVVYRALQLRLGRVVALKCLPPAVADDRQRLARFRYEAQVATRLQGAGIVPVHDILESEAGPILVMPLIEGSDLGRVLADRRAVAEGQPAAGRHPWAALDAAAYLRQVLPVLDKLVDALTVFGRNGVVHRDLKPSNVLLDRNGDVWLSDFGLARLVGESMLTAPGAQIGTQGFMSPEQWAGREDVDGRADVFSLGATLYQALTLQLPYGKGCLQADAALPAPPSKLQPLLGRDFDAVVVKALEPDRLLRYPSAAELQEDWRRARQGLPPRHARRAGRLRRLVRRHPWGTAAVVLLCLLGAALAYTLSLGPADPTVTRSVRVTTEPAGARVVLVPLNGETGEPMPDQALRPAGTTPVLIRRVPAGPYLVVAQVDGHGFQEVYRQVPSPGQWPGRYPHLSWQQEDDGTVALATIRVPGKDAAKGMAFFPGGEFTMGSPDLELVPPHRREVPAFFLDTAEVSVASCRHVNGLLPSALLNAGPPPDAHPVTYVSFEDATAYAEKVGKRLPEEAEYEFAATGGGKRKYPWGDEPPPGKWEFGPAGQPAHDRTPTRPAVAGLFSNVAEWTATWYYPYPGSDPSFFINIHRPENERVHREARVVRGGPPSVVLGKPAPAEVAWGPRFRHGFTRDSVQPGLGFRCARSARPRFLRDRP